MGGGQPGARHVLTACIRYKCGRPSLFIVTSINIRMETRRTVSFFVASPFLELMYRGAVCRSESNSRRENNEPNRFINMLSLMASCVFFLDGLVG